MLETLEVNSEILDNIHEEFKTIISKGEIKVHSFQEARGISGMKGLDKKVCYSARLHSKCRILLMWCSRAKVVDDFSSKLDLPRVLETVESIDANHMQMARYSSREDQGYCAICGVLKRFIQRELQDQRNSPASAANVFCT